MSPTDPGIEQTEHAGVGADLAAHLARCLREHRGGRLTFPPYYAQWASGGSVLQVEVVSNSFLDEAHQLTVFGESRLRSLGFWAPTNSAPNWTLWFDDERYAAEVGEAVVAALTDAFRIPLDAVREAVRALPRPQGAGQLVRVPPANVASAEAEESAARTDPSAPRARGWWVDPRDGLFILSQSTDAGPRTEVARILVSFPREVDVPPRVEVAPSPTREGFEFLHRSTPDLPIDWKLVYTPTALLAVSYEWASRLQLWRRSAAAAGAKRDYPSAVAGLASFMRLPETYRVELIPTDVRFDDLAPRMQQERLTAAQWESLLGQETEAEPSMTSTTAPSSANLAQRLPGSSAPGQVGMRKERDQAEQSLRDKLRDRVVDTDDRWDTWVDAPDRRVPGLIRRQPVGALLPARVTIEQPGVVEVVVDIGEFYWDPESYDELMDFESDLVSIIMTDSVVRDERAIDDESADERRMIHLHASSRIDLDEIEKKLPLAAIIALVRRKAVAVLIRVYDQRDTAYGPRWLGEALFPDRTAVARLLEPAWPPGVASDLRIDLEDSFERAGLGRPWIPEATAHRIGVTDRWLWSTRSPTEEHHRDRAEAYEFFPVVLRSLSDPSPRFSLCHTGHGLNSWALVYEWVSPRMSVVTLTGWGGVYTNADVSTSRMRLLAADLAVLEELSQSLVDWPRDDNRLLVWSSEFAGSMGRWWHPSGEPVPTRAELLDEGERAVHMPWDLENDDLGTTLGSAVRQLEYELAVDLGLLEYD